MDSSKRELVLTKKALSEGIRKYRDALFSLKPQGEGGIMESGHLPIFNNEWDIHNFRVE
jgi:hypothetical protein